MMDSPEAKNLEKYCLQVLETIKKRRRELRRESAVLTWKKKRYEQMLMDVRQYELEFEKESD